MGHYVDTGDEFLYIPYDDINAEKKNKDGSLTLKLLGGPYHDLKVRLYAPYDQVRFPCGATYEIAPPLKNARSQKWKLVHSPGLVFGIQRGDV